MRRCVRAVAVAGLLSFASATAHAQTRGARDTAFADLRRDGNGIAALRTSIDVGFDRQPARDAFRVIADLARLNLTFDPRLEGLGTLVTVSRHVRSAAVALTEVAAASRLLVRVSADGQLVIAASAKPHVDGDSLPRSAVELPAVRTQAARAERQNFEMGTNVSGVSITGHALAAAPQFIEPDLLRSVQLLPGIAARSDYAAGFNVRGGEADQTLILIDGYPIYNPFHLGGVFSTFIDATVGRVDLRTGAMPAQFGGRLSGVLDVHSAEPSRADAHGTAEVSLVSSSASVGSAFANGAGSWLVAARRTYADAVVDLFKRGGFPYHFRDIQGHISHTLIGGMRIAATAYDGVDAATSITDGTRGSWGNRVLGATLGKHFLNHPSLLGIHLGDSVVVEQRASISTFDAGVNAPANFIFADNGVDDRRVGGTVSFHGARLTHTLGYEVAGERLRYAASSSFGGFGDIFPFDSVRQRTGSRSVFIDELWRVTPRLLLDAGARADAVEGLRSDGVSPRLSLKYFITPDFAVTAAGGRYTQWIHSLGREEEPVQPLQFWVAGDTSRPASRATDAVLGLERWVTPSRLLHVEAFYKRYEDLLIPNNLSDPGTPGDEFDATHGTSYGLDLLLRQLDGGPFSGWLSYTYARTTRVAAGGATYSPSQDRRHNLNVVGSWKTGGFTLGARANLASGLPYTPVTGSFVRNRYDPALRRWVPDPIGLDQQTLSGALNSERLPWYDRVDVSVSHAGRFRGAAVSPYLSVVNLLNAHNPAAYIYDFIGRSRRGSFPNLPFAPTFGVSVAY